MSDFDENPQAEGQNTDPVEPQDQEVVAGDLSQDSLFPCPERELTTEMEESYLSYAMSVIASRALPDVRDGLKPVHRRILFAMHEMGLRSGAKFRKSASVVGEVLGKYHPHGDSAVYDSMVRMAQEFSLRYPLVWGQGNFGSVDGDNAAAMRYTEAKMQRMTDEMLADIEKETVDFRPNYDGRLQEPIVLPARVPQLLLNGTMGIAVGMATNIPPHNAREVIDATLALIRNPEIDIDGLLEYIKGPDFPTAGIIYDREAIRTAYATGRGSVIMRGKAEIVEIKGGKSAIIITEIPYQVNKSSLVEKIADLVRDKKLMGITDLRDESNRVGMRIVIEMKKDAFPSKILNQLYKLTNLQDSFGFNMIALTDRGMQPKLFDLKTILEEFIKHRVEVVERRTTYDLKIAEARAHILEGLEKALDHIDEVIKTIRAARTQEAAKTDLMAKFGFSDLQAEAILAMQLRRLAALERQKIADELAEKMAFIATCKAILGDPARVRSIISTELTDIRNRYGDERRTEVVENAIGKFSAKDTIPNEEMIVAITTENYVKRMQPSQFRSQARGGKGVIGATMKDEEDEVSVLLSTKNHNDLLFFTNLGRVFRLPTYEIPLGSRTAKGQAIVNFLQLQKDESVTAILDVTAHKGNYLFMATVAGTVKKTPVEAFANVRKNGLIAIKLRTGDSLNWVKSTTGQDEIMMVSHNGKAIRFNEKDVRPMGRGATGVRGLKIKADDQVIEMDIVRTEGAELLVVMENGLGKSTSVSEYRGQHRGGSGVKVANVTNKTGKVIGAKVVPVDFDGDLILLSKDGLMIRMKISEIPSRGRATQGVILMRMKDATDTVCSVTMLASEKDIEEAKKLEEQAVAFAKANPIVEEVIDLDGTAGDVDSAEIEDEEELIAETGATDEEEEEGYTMLPIDFAPEEPGSVFKNPEE